MATDMLEAEPFQAIEVSRAPNFMPHRADVQAQDQHLDSAPEVQTPLTKSGVAPIKNPEADEITSLEAELDEIDLEDSFEDQRRLMSRDYDASQPHGEGAPRSRRVILREIKTKLLEYGMHTPIINLGTDN
ncbi:hypothetical protein IG631_02473 [Alternaria alternata]|nr:hypothetical protein IG631_02473 [Alternaria alternata]